MGLWGTSLGEESLLGNVQRSVRGAGTRPYREEAGWAVVPTAQEATELRPTSHTCLRAQPWEALRRKTGSVRLPRSELGHI